MTLEMNMNTGSHASVLQSTIPYSRASSTAHRRIACRDCSLYGVLPVSRRICETIAPPRGGHRGGRAETTSQMVAVYDVVKIAGISQMYDSIQAVLTSQLRYLALWNESTATKTAMS